MCTVAIRQSKVHRNCSKALALAAPGSNYLIIIQEMLWWQNPSATGFSRSLGQTQMKENESDAKSNVSRSHSSACNKECVLKFSLSPRVWVIAVWRKTKEACEAKLNDKWKTGAQKEGSGERKPSGGVSGAGKGEREGESASQRGVQTVLLRNFAGDLKYTSTFGIFSRDRKDLNCFNYIFLQGWVQDWTV